MAKTIVAPPTVHKTVGYSHAIRSGNTLYISGQVAQEVNGKMVGPGDIKVQGEQVYANLKAIVESCGGTMDNIVKLTTYATNLALRPALVEIRNRFVPKSPHGEHLRRHQQPSRAGVPCGGRGHRRARLTARGVVFRWPARRATGRWRLVL